MRDYVAALRAVFRAFQQGTPLRHEGTHYRLDRLQPFFRPAPLPGPPPPVWLGAVGPRMTRVAGEVADRVLTHPTCSDPIFLSEVTRPLLREGAALAGREDGGPGIVASPLVATGPTPEVVHTERERIRGILAFVYATPAYRQGLAHHGRGDLADALAKRAREGRYGELGALVDEEILDLVVPSGTFDEIAPRLLAAYEGLAAALTLRLPAEPAHDAGLAAVLGALRRGRADGSAPRRGQTDGSAPRRGQAK
jgi:probable F420-dependent oxidoreductase